MQRHAHTHSLSHTKACSDTHKWAYSQFLTPLHSRTHTYTHSNITQWHTHMQSLSHKGISDTHTRAYSQFLTLLHSHTHTYTHTHYAMTCSFIYTLNQKNYPDQSHVLSETKKKHLKIKRKMSNFILYFFWFNDMVDMLSLNL